MSSSTRSSPSTSSSPSPQGLLFAALEARGTSNWNTVAIAGLDGYARGKTTFRPMANPYIGCAGVVVRLSAHAAAGKVYFADGTGLVRALSVGGRVDQVTSFPLISSQQLLSFAVSPDGSHLLATVFTLPPRPATDLTCNGPPT